MRLSGPATGHLTYCTNIHAAEHWPDVLAGLRRHLPTIKQAFAPDERFGVGLRLSASAARALAEPAALADLIDLLGDDYYVFTLNGFPYGAFHGAPVKENAYRPDWSEPARLEYSNALADILARLLPPGMTGTVSTVPGTFKPWAEREPARVDAIVEHLIAHAAHLVALREDGGNTIQLALEPEPYCLLETIAETVEFFTGRLFDDRAARRLGALTGLPAADAHDALRRHLGVCYDVCHAAVEFEDPRASVQALRRAGIGIGKLQLSSALRIAPVGADGIAQLRPFDEPVYLHQVVQRRRGELTRFADLDAALARADAAGGGEWRVHFHVPVFLEQMQHFGTTQAFLREILALHREQPIAAHLEVETYSWDVLPEGYRNVGVGEAIARELNWVRERLTC